VFFLKGSIVGNVLDDHVRAYQGQNIYDFDNLIQLKWYPERIVQFSTGAKSLLELGLGHGITADVFGRYFRRHVVIDASSAVIANFQQRFPDFKFTLIGEPNGYGDHVRFSWGLGPDGADSPIKGTDFAVLSDGRIRSITGFLDQVPAGA